MRGLDGDGYYEGLECKLVGYLMAVFEHVERVGYE